MTSLKWLKLATVALLSSATTAHARDVFDTLQNNAWYLPTTDQSARIFVTSLGEGQKVVVIHGGFGANFEYMVNAVRPHVSTHEFILYDQRGSLLSRYGGKPEDLTMDDLVDDLELLRKQLGEERLMLMAHSMGSRLAIEYARRYPDRLRSLILLGTFPPSMTDKKDSEAYSTAVNKRGYAMAERDAVKAVIKSEGLADLAPDKAPDGAEEIAGAYVRTTNHWRIRFAGVNMVRVEKWRLMQGGKAYYNGDVAGPLGNSLSATWDLKAALGNRSLPISILQGDQDYVDPGASGWLKAKQDGGLFARCVTVKVIERAGHVAWLDDPDAFHNSLTQALNRTGC